MTHDELRWAINSVAEQPACETVGHWSSAKALRAVVELHRPEEIRNLSGDLLESYCFECEGLTDYPCPTIQAIEKELER